MQRYLGRILILVLLEICLSVSLALADPAIRAVTLTWTDDARTTQTITWQTAGESSNIYVQYSEADTPDAEFSAVMVEPATTTSFVSDMRENKVHSVTLRNLKPGTRYVYRLGDGTNWLHDGVFMTEKIVDNFQFLVFSDSQSTDYQVWRSTFTAAFRANRQVKFFVNLGDLVDNGQKQQEWDGWFAGIAAHSSNLPVVPVVGNHETYAADGQFSLPTGFTAQFKLPQNGPVGLKGQVYSFDYGDVHFVVLDSQFGEERAFLPDSLELQKAWLRRDLAATNKLWKVVFMHRPIYNNRVGEAKAATVQFIPIFDAYNVDVVLSGHEHVNARTAKLRADKKSLQGTIYATLGRSGTKVYNDMERKTWNEQFFNPLDQPTYTVITISGGVFYAQVFTQSGEFVDEWSLTKIHQ